MSRIWESTALVRLWAEYGPAWSYLGYGGDKAKVEFLVAGYGFFISVFSLVVGILRQSFGSFCFFNVSV